MDKIHFVSLTSPVSIHLIIHLSSRLCYRHHSQLLPLTYKVIHSLICLQPHRSTHSSSDVVTPSRPPTISSSKITDCSFWYASSRLWNQLPDLFRQPSQSVSFLLHVKYTHYCILSLLSSPLFKRGSRKKHWGGGWPPKFLLPSPFPYPFPFPSPCPLNFPSHPCPSFPSLLISPSLLFPFSWSLPSTPCPLSFPPFPPLRSRPLHNPARGSNLVHFSFKIIGHLVATILIIFLRINWPNFVHFVILVGTVWQ